ncbi:hypothetical protein RG963_05525 [Methanosarcina sp. Z-7115]|uniref:Biotin synthesis protein BioC n=1 Tax=Methanosarcina baikalica TaxID=3073890 RepID=A0ABU2CZT4_9EURY|nr:hypothetical protein [Methanosarcina sp. Z-7115]MDR7665251.1 hypothetical protein [Methanosarcina sp. Z-7115]
MIFSNSALHWIKSSEPVLKGFSRSLRTEGTLLAQFGGRGNAAGILKIIDSILEDEKWNWYLRDFVFPYGFYGPEEYREWLKNTGFIVKRLEMNSKDMALVGKESLPQ